MLKRQWELAKQHGAQLILLIPPTLAPYKFVPDPAVLPGVKTLDFDRPDLYPELFLLSNRRDETHLNANGADLFTKLIAKRLLQECGAPISTAGAKGKGISIKWTSQRFAPH